MSFKNEKVLNFYEKLPFNIFGDIALAEKQIEKNDPLEIYPQIKLLIDKQKKTKIIDVGCGGGWFINSLIYHHENKFDATGVDFNPKVIEYADRIKKNLKLKSKFISADLFTLDGKKEEFDLVVSLGVLHHTNNCHEAIKSVCNLGKKGSYLFLGLYHKYGREPFLNFFRSMKDQSEENKFKEYKKLHKNVSDEKKLYSWFRDQVLHPHETQHTFEEIYNLLISLNYQVLSTSINKFQSLNKINEVFKLEKTFYEYSQRKLLEKEYFPGFFITIAKKIS